MKSALRDLLSWVWQVILTWVTGIATNADLSLCIEQTAKMGVKATDPEMGLAHDDPQDDETKSRNETARLIVKEKQVVNTFLNGVTSDVVVTSDVMIGENERNEIEENNSNRVETDSDKNGAEVSADSLIIANSDSNEVESNSDLTYVNEEGISSNDNEEETERTENQEENVNNSVVNDSASSNTEVNEGTNASNSDKANKAQNGNSNNRNQSDDESDTDEDEDEEDYDGGYGRGNVAKDVKVTLLLDLSSNAAYQKLLSPQYYSLNFRTVAPLQEENVRTALKKLRSMLPWLGLGFRQQKGAMWLCLYSEDNIDFQTVNYEESQWYLVTNCREQFSYFENGCLCTFRLMKVHPCIQCQRDIMEMQTNGTSSVSLETSACSRTASTSTISTSMTKDGEVFSASNCKDTGANYGSVGSIKGVTDPSIINIINSEIPSIHTVNDEFTALSVPNSDSDSFTITEVKSSASLSSNTEKQSAANVPVNLLSGSDTSKDSKETTTFEHNYCLVFGIPQPLVDETAADVICDAFIKELNNGISVTTSASSDPENKHSCHTSEVNSESDESNVNRDTCSEDNDNQLNNPQSDNATIVSDNDTDNATIVSDNDTDNATIVSDNDTDNAIIVSDNGTDNATIVADNDTVNATVVSDNATIVSDNDTSDIVTDNNNKQVSSEVIVHQNEVTNSIEEQENFDEIKSSVQEQLTIIENVLASDGNINIDKNDQNRVRNNNINVIDRNSPRIDRQIEVTVTQNFLNKCKRDRVNFVSGFTACVNSAVANTLVKYGIKQENEEFKIGHIISLHNNLEDLSDDDWHDRDYDDDDDDEDDDEQRKVPCCKPATVNLNIRSKDYCPNRFWERVQFINQKRWEMCTDALGASVQKIPLHSEQANKEDRFPSICQPNANLSIANISGLISKYSRQLEHVESVTFQRLSPLLIFLMTNTLSLTVHEKCLRFTFYNQEHFVPHPTAHQFADEIESILKESLVS